MLWLGLWVALMVALVAAHRVQPPAQLALHAWTLTGLDPPSVVAPNVTLPHGWREFTPNLRAARYETQVELAAARAEPWAIYVPSVGMNAAVFVNGMRIGDGASLTEPLARRAAHPLLLRVPDATLRAGANSLVVDLHAAPAGSGFLQQVYLGPQAQLQRYFDLRYFIKTDFIQGLLVAVVVVAIIMCGVWSVRRTERVYLWYALTSLAFVVYCVCFVAPSLSLPSWWWDWLQYVGRGWMIAAVTVFGLHFLGLSRPRLVAFLGVISLLGPLALAALAAVRPEYLHEVLVRVWANATLGFGLYPVSLFVRELWRRTDARSFWMLAAAVSLLIGGAHDVLLENGLLAPYAGHYFQYTTPLAIVVFTWLLGVRFLRALEEAETLNRELNDRVLRKQAELEHTYQQLKHSEQQRTLADERERIQRDMHDGLGGTLVSALAGLEMQGDRQSGAAQSLRTALDDLRLMIYSLDQTSGTLRAALAMLRERLTRLAEDAGLAIEWNMQDLPADFALERGVTLQLMRIVQEAFTNTVKHARAKTFRLAASPHEGRVSIEISDDGAGFDATTAKSGGYGLANMCVRAQKIGAELEIGPASPGTRITLRVPAS